MVITALLIVIASVASWGDLDWSSLSLAGRELFGHDGLHVYARNPWLQDGPPLVLLYAGLARLGQDVGAVVTHVAMWALLFWVLRTATPRKSADASSKRVHLHRAAIIAVAVLPALVWNLPPFNAPEALLWTAAFGVLGGWMLLPRRGVWLRTRVDLGRAELFGLLLIGSWALLASASAHVEDAIAIALVIWAAVQTDRYADRSEDSTVRAAIAVGIAMAFKPWAVAGVAVLIRRGRPLMVLRDLAIAGSLVVASWLPFIFGSGGLHAASTPLPISGISSLTFIGFGGGAPSWMRAVQLAAIVVAALAARRSGAADSVAAAMAVRLLLDPASYLYYLSPVLLAVGIADLTRGRGPWRLLAATASLWLVPCFVTDVRVVAVIRSLALLGVLASSVVAGARSTRPESVEARRIRRRDLAEATV